MLTRKSLEAQCSKGAEICCVAGVAVNILCKNHLRMDVAPWCCTWDWISGWVKYAGTATECSSYFNEYETRLIQGGGGGGGG